MGDRCNSSVLCLWILHYLSANCQHARSQTQCWHIFTWAGTADGTPPRSVHFFIASVESSMRIPAFASNREQSSPMPWNCSRIYSNENQNIAGSRNEIRVDREICEYIRWTWAYILCLCNWHNGPNNDGSPPRSLNKRNIMRMPTNGWKQIWWWTKEKGKTKITE